MTLKFHVMEILNSADSLPGTVNHITFLFEFSTFFSKAAFLVLFHSCFFHSFVIHYRFFSFFFFDGLAFHVGR